MKTSYDPNTDTILVELVNDHRVNKEELIASLDAIVPAAKVAVIQEPYTVTRVDPETKEETVEFHGWKLEVAGAGGDRSELFLGELEKHDPAETTYEKERREREVAQNTEIQRRAGTADLIARLDGLEARILALERK